jgi:hypothetical protein
LLDVKLTVDELVDNYNNGGSEHKIHEGVEIIKNYLCLILLNILKTQISQK